MPSLARRVLALLVVAALAVVAVIAQLGGGGGCPALKPGAGGDADPLSYAPQREPALVAAAALGNAHVLYAKSPGGALASAQRTARYRPLIDAAARAAGIDPDTLEAIVLLESAGRPDAVADPTLQGAVGLTQILAETARDLLGMRVDPHAALRIGRSLRRAAAKGDGPLVARLRARRERVDERFDPAKSLAATARYLTIARKALHRDDLAVESYHMGIGNLQTALRLYGDDVSYARLYFDSTPLRHAAAYDKLATLGDDSATYLWRIAAAREIMRLYRSDPAQLERVSVLQNDKNSAEEVLHPEDRTQRFTTPAQLRAAYAGGAIFALAPAAKLAKEGLRMDPGMGELAPRLHQHRTLYRGLRAPALAMLEYIGAGVKAISGQSPLVVTSTVRDQGYQDQLLATDPEATPNYSLHTTGWAFDISRTYRTHAQALAFEFLLDRLQSENLIAWVREPAAIHVTVSSAAASLVGVVG